MEGRKPERKEKNRNGKTEYGNKGEGGTGGRREGNLKRSRNKWSEEGRANRKENWHEEKTITVVGTGSKRYWKRQREREKKREKERKRERERERTTPTERHYD